VYRACIHCCQDLGQNEVIEPFPVGRRLAFDSAKGRLWVVCPHCGRWNLTPLEERWEAVEECERRFRGLRLRAQTSNIGLGRLSEGLELVRIGKPLRPEFAAWRYGREFGRRRTRQILGATGVGLALGGIAAVGAYAGVLIFVPHVLGLLIGHAQSTFKPALSVDLPRGPGRSWQVSTEDAMILPDPVSGFRLSMRHHFGHAELAGDEARRWLSYLLARVNRAGGSDGLVTDAVKQIEAASPDAFITQLAEESARLWAVDGEKIRAVEAEANKQLFWHDYRDRHNSLARLFGEEDDSHPINRAGLSRLPATRRLALEMALHESTEQRAIDGELAALETAWREAEEIAGIADNLLLPEGVNARIAAANAAASRESGRG